MPLVLLANQPPSHGPSSSAVRSLHEIFFAARPLKTNFSSSGNGENFVYDVDALDVESGQFVWNVLSGGATESGHKNAPICLARSWFLYWATYATLSSL